jgi:hypothetical protein
MPRDERGDQLAMDRQRNVGREKQAAVGQLDGASTRSSLDYLISSHGEEVEA